MYFLKKKCVYPTDRVSMFREMDEYEFVKELFKYQTLDPATIISDDDERVHLLKKERPDAALEKMKTGICNMEHGFLPLGLVRSCIRFFGVWDAGILLFTMVDLKNTDRRRTLFGPVQWTDDLASFHFTYPIYSHRVHKPNNDG